VTAKPAALAGVGAYALQIGAYKSQSDADAAWKAYEAKHPIVGGYSEDVQKADLGAKGTWYRLRISSFSDKTAATALCGKLKADGGNCFLAK
jgi:cell division protein FtsN